MSDKQNPSPHEKDSTPPQKDQSLESMKSYYYDDATGYEIYNEESDDVDDEESGDDPSR
ncbi:MAG: hypothetical protein QOE96_1110 [Blastocatellia bacterium]|jgi:hypothetical protein|nr:hypothetical protein [Blastocatellia bacterium]